MIKIKRYQAGLADWWDDFIKKSKNGIFMFNRPFMDYHSDRFQDNSLMFYDDDELMALLPVSRHGHELRSHGGLTYGGFITDEKMKQHKMLACFDVLQKYMQENDFTKLVYKTIPYIYHKQPAQEDIYALYRNNAKLLKIEPSTTLLLKYPLKMPKGRSAQISRAKREGVTIELSNDFETFIRLENAILQERHHTRAVHTAEELKRLQSNFENKIQLWAAIYQEEMIAATLLFVYDNVVHTQYLAANAIARKIGGLDLLIKTVMDKFAPCKTYFDFGISTEKNGQILNEGLIHQKEGFGGRTVCYYTWEINV